MAERSAHAGSCHCGNLRLVFESGRAPGELFLRRCGCSFCRRHGGRYVSDPEGGLSITVGDPEKLRRYRFGHKTADFLICGACGVFVAAVMEDGGASFAVINVNSLEQAEAFGSDAPTQDYDAEDPAERLARRRRRWTPVLSFTEG